MRVPSNSTVTNQSSVKQYFRSGEEQEIPKPWTQEMPIYSPAPVQSVYESADVSVFGSPYSLDRAGEADGMGFSNHDEMVEQVAMLNFYEHMMSNKSSSNQIAKENMWGESSSNVASNPSFQGTRTDNLVSDMQNGDKEVRPVEETFGYIDAARFWSDNMNDTDSSHSSPKASTSTASITTLTPQEIRSDNPFINASSPTPIQTNVPTSCIICIEDLTPTLSPPPFITPSCTHQPSLCTSCLSKCITTGLTTKPWNQLTCPECPVPLTYPDIRRHATPSTFARYEELSFRSAVGADADFVWCPAPNCGFGQLHATGMEQPIVRCEKCGFRSCFRHGGVWHERLSCEEFEEMQRERVWKRQVEEEASMSTVEKTTKKCPGCSWPIEKNAGCAHMTYTKCCAQFCWNCFADHKKIDRYGNDQHDVNCQFHTDNLPH
ncbi:uncharacterized protein LY89DRAFT_653517 [Mollisia scopiformis]|uniref:RBR-type E3 ubiquitin transferase n=1 Tax=Mollisia scopiformis TaxID=149040 RepID=A0A194WVG8_MOLSC|nr:uncharacterized protein LY89DRAFT_653517 [Mollisia scopiformis]KUJ11963.1 hypothetical protein LY89DRAFT_653517 [Mollisia scopiformis]